MEQRESPPEYVVAGRRDRWQNASDAPVTATATLVTAVVLPSTSWVTMRKTVRVAVVAKMVVHTKHQYQRKRAEREMTAAATTATKTTASMVKPQLQRTATAKKIGVPLRVVQSQLWKRR